MEETLVVPNDLEDVDLAPTGRSFRQTDFCSIRMRTLSCQNSIHGDGRAVSAVREQSVTAGILAHVTACSEAGHGVQGCTGCQTS